MTGRFALSAAIALAFSLPGAALAEPAAQKVIISFDGALHNEQWERSRRIAADTGARFTYFLSCVYLITRDDRQIYHPPTKARGASNVGFGYSREDIAARLDHIWQARAEGHEIASHGCGHFDGKDWTKADWRQEFSEFSRILGDAWQLNGRPEPEGWRDFARTEIRGFRAPYLSTSAGLLSAISEAGMLYDASTVSRDPAHPDIDAGPIRFALPMIPEGVNRRRVLAMDYNLFVRHSGGTETEDVDGEFEDRAFTAFMRAFRAERDGDRVPLQIGMHFTLMNGGAYWNAMERFARTVCVMEDVECVSYADMLPALTD